jgi:hypothetical protein
VDSFIYFRHVSLHFSIWRTASMAPTAILWAAVIGGSLIRGARLDEMANRR